MLIMCSCTRQSFTRNLGGTMKINLPAGQELVMATWKGNDIFYLTKPMSEDYVPVEKTFQESSSWGVIEAKIIFVEKR